MWYAQVDWGHIVPTTPELGEELNHTSERICVGVHEAKSFMLIENRIKRKIEYEKTDREDKDESRSRKRTRDQVFPIKG